MIKRIATYFSARSAAFLRVYIVQSINYAREEYGVKARLKMPITKYSYSFESFGKGLVISEISYFQEVKRLKRKGCVKLSKI